MTAIGWFVLSFAEMEKEFTAYAQKNNLTSGTTCTCVILDKRTGTVHVANIGDCEAVLSKRGFHFFLLEKILVPRHRYEEKYVVEISRFQKCEKTPQNYSVSKKIGIFKIEV